VEVWRLELDDRAERGVVTLEIVPNGIEKQLWSPGIHGRRQERCRPDEQDVAIELLLAAEPAHKLTSDEDAEDAEAQDEGAVGVRPDHHDRRQPPETPHLAFSI